MDSVWLRDLDGTGSLHVCSQGDPGAIEFVRAGAASEAPPAWLALETFGVQHNPNCPGSYLVRLIGKGKGSLDWMNYWSFKGSPITRDVLGFGKTLKEAAENAAKARREQGVK